MFLLDIPLKSNIDQIHRLVARKTPTTKTNTSKSHFYDMVSKCRNEINNELILHLSVNKIVNKLKLQ